MDEPVITLARVRAAYDVVACLTAADPIYMPIFKRLEREIEEMEAAERAARALHAGRFEIVGLRSRSA